MANYYLKSTEYCSRIITVLPVAATAYCYVVLIVVCVAVHYSFIKTIFSLPLFIHVAPFIRFY